jgi:protein SCO1/2
MNVPRLKEGDTWPNFTLTDQGGWPITRADYGGAMVLVTFTFTRCELPNDCSQVARNFSEILRQTAAIPALKGRVRLLSISFDPAFDTPERLASHAGRLTQDTDTWRFASGKADETGRLTASFSVRVQPEEDTIGHSLCTALIGPDGVIRKIWRGDGWTADEAVAEITSAVSP